MPDNEYEVPELSDVAYLRDLAERLRNVPCMYGTDGYDIDRLQEVAQNLEIKQMQE